MDRRSFLKSLAISLMVFPLLKRFKDIEIGGREQLPENRPTIMINEIDIGHLGAELNYSCPGILDYPESLKEGWTVYTPGPVTRGIKIFGVPKRVDHIQIGETVMLHVPPLWSGNGVLISRTRDGNGSIVHEYRL